MRASQPANANADDGRRHFVIASFRNLALHAFHQPVHAQNLAVSQRLARLDDGIAFIVFHDKPCNCHKALLRFVQASLFGQAVF